MINRRMCLYLFWFFAAALFSPTFAAAQRYDRDDDVLPGPGWQVMRAEWGAGDRWVDVTSRVRLMLSGSGTVKVNNTNMGGDPSVGATKILRIRARRFRGQSRQFTFREGDYIDAREFYNYGGGIGEDNGEGWRVMWAEWGSGDRNIDVTGRVRELLSGNGTVKVNNTNLGGDPAVGAKKVLHISARDLQGQVRHFSFDEGSYIDASQFYNYRGPR